ncbi:YopX family protein [Bacillus velezensis]|uniref:YopX family protein n=1 Tax=Bacillus velezensis TaxID=492670 RepID=UPI00255C26EE|nr:YopX family protein [Bacillus velezensis]MDL5023381.1 YopX family protein [Bacillus velezensis]
MNTAYRVWDGEQMYYYGDEGICLSIGELGSIDGKVFGWSLWLEGYGVIAHSGDGKSVLMWGTGLKDKNEKMIYEKDVIKFKSVYCGNKIIKAVVKFRDSLGSFVFDRGNDQDFWRMDVSISEIEVIGDVYQKPELLEGAE